ncbi:MAG TPA: dihydrolipoamide dehydrogenase [Saprospirales bacterium]|nr:dihydrolipoamide dehydrogenase [Saprospirales bacterium]
MKQLIFLTALLAVLGTANAQIKTPAPSPVAKINQEVGLIKVDVEYSRPSAKGRKVFGDLVPFGTMWRTGANASTKVTVSDDAKVAGNPLPKGTYALYTIPGEKEWTIIFYKNTTFWGTPEPKDFKEEDVQARFTVPSVPQRDLVETFSINISNLRNNGADLEIVWEYTKVIVPIMVDTDSKVMKAIQTTMAGPSGNDYYGAARYYYEEKKDMTQALTWVDKSLEIGGDKFWILRLKANILAELGRYKDAIMVAQKSTELAQKEGNEDYPRMNEKSIAEWSKKK